jgi:2-iminoacetate synthase ThiH
MDAYIEQAGLGRILAKVRAGERLTLEDGRSLYKHPNILALGYLANIVRERKNGNRPFSSIISTSTIPTSVQICANSVHSAKKRGMRSPTR